ncbi:hypothetical protein [Micromonospora wenchangensis]|uniref:hypothetical protein n=1 Tax=Micromonospora wenchangensis TaxID=1185415 RepID=UPI003D723C6F
MSHPNGSLWVDPEGVVAVGDTYLQHIERYDECLRHLRLLRARYGLAWGDDDLGDEFQKRFDATMDGVEGSILGVRAFLEYAAVGLHTSGEGYRQADEDAAQAGRRVAGEFAHLPASFAAAGPGEDPSEPAQLTPTHGLMAFAVDPPVPGGPRQFTPTHGFVAARTPPAGDAPHADEPTPLTPLTPVTSFAPPSVPPVPLEPVTSFVPRSAVVDRPTTRLTPAISTFRTYDTAGLLVDGVPVPPGYRLQAVSTFADGTSRIDANHYDSVVPLGNRRPTTADGQPVDPVDGQFFLVKPKKDADVESCAPDYRPLVVSFAPDGSATPMTGYPG